MDVRKMAAGFAVRGHAAGPAFARVIRPRRGRGGNSRPGPLSASSTNAVGDCKDYVKCFCDDLMTRGAQRSLFGATIRRSSTPSTALSRCVRHWPRCGNELASSQRAIRIVEATREIALTSDDVGRSSSPVTDAVLRGVAVTDRLRSQTCVVDHGCAVICCSSFASPLRFVAAHSERRL